MLINIYSVWPVGREKFTNAKRIRAKGAPEAVQAYIHSLGTSGRPIRPPRLICVDEITKERKFFGVEYHTKLTGDITEITKN